VALLILFVGLLLTQASAAAVDAAVAGACILLGLAWIVLGWVFVPSVETYLGPGASRGIPILWPSDAIPERNAAVLRDLKGKLSWQTDMGVTLALLGILLMAVGFIFYAAAPVGLILLIGFLVCLAALFAYTFLPSPAEPAADRARVPPNH